MYETLLMIHWREWKHAMPETPSGTERMSRATQPDVKAAEGGKAVIYYAHNNIQACSWIFSVWLVELFWTRADQTQICASNLPLSTGTAVFSLVFIIQHTPCPRRFHRAFYAHSSWRSFDNLRPTHPGFEGISGKTAGLSGCPAKLSVVHVGGWEFGETGGLSL